MINSELSKMAQDILTIISEVTGHNSEDLEMDMYLESDLGFDSIKMVTLMNELMKLIPKDQLEDFMKENPVNSLMILDTIGDIIEVFEIWNSSRENISREVNEIIEKQEYLQNRDNGEERSLEILNAQYPFLASYFAVGTITICNGIKIRGRLNINYLWESWRELIHRHIVLQAYFKVAEGAKAFREYKFLLADYITPPEILVHDIRHFKQCDQEQYVNSKFEEIINERFDIFEWPLHNIEVIQTQELEYEIIFSNSHLISDGLGNQEIIRELLQIYESKVSGREYNYQQEISTSHYNETVEKINLWKDQQEINKLKEYLKSQGKNKYFFNPYNNKKVYNSYAKVKSIKYSIDKDTMDRLLMSTKKWRVSVFTLLVSAYLKTIREQSSESNSIILNLPTGGKIYPNADATGMLGCFAQNLALTFNNSNIDNEPLETLVKKIDAQIKNAIAAGFDRAQIFEAAGEIKHKEMLNNGKMSPITEGFIRASLKSNLYLSFVGNTNINSYYGDINVYDYEAYTSTNAGAIDNLIEIFQGRLFISSNYDSSLFDREDIDKLINNFIGNIKELAQYEIKPQKIVNNTASYAADVIDEVSNVFNEVCSTSICSRDMDKDLEAEMGMDSLQRIRIITRLVKNYKTVDRNSLFECRTLREIISSIHKGINSYENNNSRKNQRPKEYVQGEQLIPYMKIIDQCRNTPDAVAISYEQQSVTYRELELLSNKIANYLREQGVTTGSLIGIMTLPGPNMLIGMLGILKAGAAYVPLDAAYPSDRIKYILNHAKIQILLTEQALKEDLSKILEDNENIQGLVFLDEGEIIKDKVNFVQVERDIWEEASEEAPDYISSPEDLMLIIYTSGSTGKPKGVMLSHVGYMNRLTWHQKMFNLKPGERVAQKTSCCFDISIWELFWPLMYGGTVCPVRKEIVKNPWRLAEWIIENKINIMHFVPSLFGEFIHAIEDENYQFNDLRWLIYSGEALPMSFMQKWIDKYGMEVGLANLYGPTEASIDVTCHVIKRRPGASGEISIPIGKAIDNVYILNLDENMRELPEGEVGELWIGGIQLAKGYLNNNEKTSEAFKTNPFKYVPGDYLYRTGDLTTKNAQGEYEYHGRIDNQIKIRGFRVELGEIEAVIHSHPGVKEAAVVALDYGDGQKRLVGCISGSKVEEMEIKSLVGSKLPEYMVPHQIKWLENLPKTPNGKTDRKALMKMIGTPSNIHTQKVENVKYMENNSNTVLELSTDVANAFTSGERIMPLAPAQKWLMNYFDYPYQWAGFTRFTFKQPLDFKDFNRALTLLTKKHEVLRCELTREKNKWVQKILSEDLTVNADFYDGSQLSKNQRDRNVEDIIVKTVKELKVDKWPLWKVIVVKISESSYDISVIGHHLMSDIITNGILFQDIWKIYAQLISGKNLSIEESDRKSYTDFIAAMEKEKEVNGSKFVNYWKNKFPAENSVFNIPYDFNKGPNDEASSVTEKFTLSKELSSVLLGRAKKYFNSNVYSILLAPLYKILSKNSNGSKVIISHRVNGRDFSNNYFFEAAGDFAVNFPLGINIEEKEELKTIVEKIRNEFDEVPLKGVSYDLISENLPFYMYPDLKLTPVRANYLGNRKLPEFKSIEFSRQNMDRRFSMPHQKRISILEFFFSIVDGNLVVELEYSDNLFKASAIKELGDKYISTLATMLSAVPLNNERPNRSLLEHQAEGQLSNKVAVITGGGTGIGRAIALNMAKEGAAVIIMGRTSSKLQQVTREIRSFGGEAYAVETDITDLEEVKREINSVIEKFGKIDILVNNAGITKMSSLVDTDPEEWKEIINTNLFGSYNLCYAAAPFMINKKCGKIINIGSDSSLIGYPLMTAYAASKHGVLGLTKALSEELKLHNIQVNAVCPALVDTDMAPAALKSKAIAPEKVAGVVMFLASKASDCITGETIQVYGKQDMHWFGSQQMTMLEGALGLGIRK
ncbi:non-ribosomal peptide synthetase [Clostridium pasteurianum]|uniref:non-ribosomal peptide synthetase n=1 Tax=Clostridium pasteurianum TaxID=1501 RepID=UPI0003A3C0B1|nr:non-ribosomal peptide synthetase [Clostridium pasteurianum]